MLLVLQWHHKVHHFPLTVLPEAQVECGPDGCLTARADSVGGFNSGVNDSANKVKVWRQWNWPSSLLSVIWSFRLILFFFFDKTDRPDTASPGCCPLQSEDVTAIKCCPFPSDKNATTLNLEAPDQNLRLNIKCSVWALRKKWRTRCIDWSVRQTKTFTVTTEEKCVLQTGGCGHIWLSQGFISPSPKDLHRQRDIRAGNETQEPQHESTQLMFTLVAPLECKSHKSKN